MSRANAEEEKKKMMDKFFNYAEAPIMEWLSEFINVKPELAFPDYCDDSDDIGFRYKDKQYTAYLISMGPDESSKVDSKLIENSEDVRKACSMLFDAVQVVLPSVIFTADKEYADALKGLHCIFDEKTMSFKFVVINIEEYKKINAVKQYKQLHDTKTLFEQKMAESELTGDVLSNVKAQLFKIDELMLKAKKVYEETTEEMLAADEKRCELVNEKIKTANRLYVVVEESDSSDDHTLLESLKRLPTFGTMYQDTEDVSFIDMLKKEYDLKE